MMLVDIFQDYEECCRTRDVKKKTFREKSQTKKYTNNFKYKYRQCGKKIRYDSVYEAQKYAKLYEKTRGIKLHCYECHICEGYHLTKQAHNVSHAHIVEKSANRIGARVF